jgi:hypothetical protein
MPLYGAAVFSPNSGTVDVDGSATVTIELSTDSYFNYTVTGQPAP